MDHRLKLERAHTHLENLEADIRHFFEMKAYTTVGELDEQTREYRCRVVVQRPIPREWPLIVGDCLFNLRSSLDCLAWAISRTELGGSPPDSPKVQFPVFLSPEGFQARGVGKKRKGKEVVRGLVWHFPPEAIHLVEHMQPYNGRHWSNPESHPLSQLTVLNNKDKHRQLLLTVTRTTLIAHMFPDGTDFVPGTFWWHQGPVEHGTVIHRVTLSPMGPQPEVQVDADVKFDVALAEPGPAEGNRVVELLRGIHDHIRDSIFPVLEPYA